MNCSLCKTNRSLLALFTAVVVIFAITSVQAQQIGSISTTATVMSQITVSEDQPLAFGNVYPGEAATIDKATDASAGIMNFSGAANQEITIDLVLPTYLTEVGTDQMAIEFSSTPADADAAAYNNSALATPSTAGNTAFDPHSVLSGAAVITNATGGFFVFIGGTVYPRLNQTAGAYTGTITIAVWYTGT